jgi:hypothetical protein
MEERLSELAEKVGKAPISDEKGATGLDAKAAGEGSVDSIAPEIRSSGGQSQLKATGSNPGTPTILDG